MKPNRIEWFLKEVEDYRYLEKTHDVYLNPGKTADLIDELLDEILHRTKIIDPSID